MNPGSCRDRRVPSFQTDIDPDIEPMSQDSTSAGLEHQLNRNSVLTVHYIHNDLLETIEDIGFLNAQGDEGYLIGNPGKRPTAIQFPTGATPLGQPMPRPKRRTTRSSRLQPAVREQLLLQRELHAEPPVRQLRGSRLVRRDHDADDRTDVGDGAAAGGQHRAAGRQRQPRLGPRRAAVGFARQPGRCSAAWRPIARTS